MAYPVKINCYIPGYENCAKENNRLQLMGDTSPEEPDCSVTGSYILASDHIDTEYSTFQLGETVTGEQVLRIEESSYRWTGVMTVCGNGISTRVKLFSPDTFSPSPTLQFEWGEELEVPYFMAGYPVYLTFNPGGTDAGEYTVNEIAIGAENDD